MADDVTVTWIFMWSCTKAAIEPCWPAAAETAVEGFALTLAFLLWTWSLMMYFVISAMKGKRPNARAADRGRLTSG